MKNSVSWEGLIQVLKGIFQMHDHGPRNIRPNSDSRDQAGQNVQNGVTINRISATKNKKERPAQSGNNGVGRPEDASSANRAGGLPRRKKKLTSKQIGKRIGLAAISFLVLLAIGVGLLWNYIFSGLNTQNPSGTGFPTEALTNQPPESKDITNILLLGVDSEDPASIMGNSDSIIILTVDRKNNVLKMTSIMRDCYTYIPGHSAPEKINAAYAIGGGELAMRTINNTLRLNIQKYMVVNFQSMADIIDIAGGVTLTITEAERLQINAMIPTEPVQEKGTLKLDGAQAVMYARIRHIDSDIERTRRQRDVLSALFLGFKQASAVSKAQMIQKGLSDIITNMTATEITSLGLDVLPKMANEIQQLRLPIDGYYTVVSNSVWYMNVDYNRMIPKVYEFIYGSSQPFDLVPTIPFESIKPTSKTSSSISPQVSTGSSDTIDSSSSYSSSVLSPSTPSSSSTSSSSSSSDSSLMPSSSVPSSYSS